MNLEESVVTESEPTTEQRIINIIKGLMTAANATAHSKGWYDPPDWWSEMGIGYLVHKNIIAQETHDQLYHAVTDKNPGERIALMHSELSEALEALRKDTQSNHIEGFKGVEEELADVLVRIFDFAEENNLRLPEALLAKMKFNVTREHKHGGKKF